uniref:J domain-containing protein n=1 Tax=viral metagenome TaxID=1070528 RepID=A0A6C0EJP5_9ZZZZ
MNPYAILDLKKNCSDEEIKQAYKKLALKYHPDRSIDNKEYNTERFKEIATAYEILNDKKQRNMYDITGKFNTTNINPFEAFELFKKNLDPNVEIFLKDTYKTLERKNKDNLFDSIKSLGKQEKHKIINNGLDLLTNFLVHKKDPKANSRTKCKSITNNITYNINISELQDTVKIVLPIDVYYNYQYLKFNIIDNDLSSNYNVYTQYLEQYFNYKEKKYSIKLEDSKHKIYKRKNKYDLSTTITISSYDYNKGFNLNMFHYKKPIEEFIKLEGKYMLKYELFGLPIWSKNTYGDLFIYFKLKD